MSGDMAVFSRVPDSYIVIILTTVIFSCVWGLLENQDVMGNQQPPFKEETESQTYGPSAPVLSQMDYEILGTSGFSITDVMQNTNFSDVSKTKKNNPGGKNQFDDSKHSQSNSSMRGTINLSLSVLKRHTTLAPMKVSSAGSVIHSAVTTNRPDLTSTESSSVTGAKEVSTIKSSLKFPQDFPYVKRTDSAVTATSILKVLEFRPTTNSLFIEESLQNHRQNLPTTGSASPVYKLSNQKTLTSAFTTMSADLHNETTESLEVNERGSLTVTQGSLSTISNSVATSTVQSVLTNEPSSLKAHKIETVSNLRKQNETSHTENDTELHDNINTTIVTHSLQSDNDDSPIKYPQNESLTTENTVFTQTSTIQHYSPFTQHSSTNTMLLTSSSTESETSTWTTQKISVLNRDRAGYVSTDTIASSTQLPPLQLDEELNSLIPKIDHVTTETESLPTYSSSFTESQHVTTGISPTIVTTDIKSTHVTPLFTEKPQLLVNVSGQIRIIRGMIWMYQLNDKMSAEFQYYSRKVQRMLEEMFWQTWLAKHIKKIDVHRFRRGSVMVDFRLVVKTERHIQPQEMELLFNSFLLPDGGFGGFQMDRHFTKFEIFEPVITVASSISVETNNLPQWATALIVISGASLVFVVLFGIVTVYGTFPFLSGKNHQRLKDEESARNCKPPKVECTEWERKVAAAYENLSADGIYDLDEVGENKIKAADGYRRKLENTEA